MAIFAPRCFIAFRSVMEIRFCALGIKKPFRRPKGHISPLRRTVYAPSRSTPRRIQAGLAIHSGSPSFKGRVDGKASVADGVGLSTAEWYCEGGDGHAGGWE